MTSNHDRSRLQRAQSLDPQALASIYDEYYDEIYRYVYRRVGDQEVARDLAATVFHRLLQAFHDRRGPEQSPRAWLYRTAHNAVVDFYRRAQHRRHLPLKEEVLAAASDPVHEVSVNLNAERVREAMAQLTADQQQVIGLKFLQGLTNQEVADLMEKTVGAVKALQHRALAALQRELLVDEEMVRS
jgi:RNA polymerase sigma-70 factor (ECF subfamily)